MVETVITRRPDGLHISPELRARVQKGELTEQEVYNFEEFLKQVDLEVMQHPVVTQNQYTAWFAKGAITLAVLRYFIIQFSVFSNQFLLAQLSKMINADSLESMRSSKEILANEIGVMFKKAESNASAEQSARLSEEDKDRLGDPDLVATEGSIDGSIFRFKAGHFEWLLKIGQQLGLSFNNLGKRNHGSPTTLYFCDELIRLYGSEDYNVGAGASFAIENWAAAGFWKELISGLEIFKQRELPALSLAFFTWHDKVEDQHAGHTLNELEELYFHPNFDATRFITSGKQMLDATLVFWEGLNSQRLAAN